MLFDIPLDDSTDHSTALPRKHTEYEHNNTNRHKNHAHHLILEHLPCIRIGYTLPDEKRICPCGCQALLGKVGEVISERL